MNADQFFNELNRVISLQPRAPYKIYNSDQGCLYVDRLYYCKNLYGSFDCTQCSDSFYISDSYMSVNSGDCDYAVESQLCYECVDSFKAYNCNYLEYCDNIRDSSFCYRCTGGNNLFGCVNLTNKSFCIFNRQFSEVEYNEKVKKYKAMPASQILAYVEELKKLYPVTQTIGDHNQNTSYGNYIHYDINCYLCFDAAHDENCMYVYDTFYCKNSMDMTYSGQNVELGYEIVDSGDINNCNFIVDSKNCQESSYLINCLDVKNSIGCAGLAHKQYCILNRQFTKEEYEKLAPLILQELKARNAGWGNLVF